MRIDPVYVLSPRPQPPSVPTRRAFLIASGTFIAGGACGYSLGVGRVGGANSSAHPDQVNQVTWQPSPDAELEEMRRLAVRAHVDELFEKSQAFLATRVSTYKFDEIVWLGVERMVREIIDNPARVVDEFLITVIIGQIEGVARPRTPSLREQVGALRARQRAMRQRK